MNNKKVFLTVRELAQEGIFSEYCIRNMLKEGKLPVVYSGKKALINYNKLLEYLDTLTVNI